MNFLKSKGTDQVSWSISTRLLTTFCLCFIIIAATLEAGRLWGLPFTGYRGTWRQERDDAFKSLNLIADLKKERIERWLHERVADTKVLAVNPALTENISLFHEINEKALFESSTLTENIIYASLLRYIKNIKGAHGIYSEILIADAATGQVLVSTDPTSVGRNISNEPHFLGALGSAETYVDGKPRKARADFSPILHVSQAFPSGKDKNALGVIILAVELEEIVKPMLHAGEGLAADGEALLVDGDGTIFTSLKHRLFDGTTAKPLEYRINAIPAKLAASGKEGMIEELDYREEPVLAAYRHVKVGNGQGWGLVVKRDEDEVYAPLRRNLIFSVALETLGITIFAALALCIAKSIVKPLHVLAKTAAEIDADNFSVRAPQMRSKELSRLTNTFNAMLDRLETWSEERKTYGQNLEKMVQTRTEDLNIATLELRREIRERTQAEKSLVEAQKIAHLGSWDWDILSDEVVCSEEIYNLLGVNTKTGVLSKNFYIKRIHPEDRAEVEAQLQAALKGERFCESQHRLIRDDGEIRFFHNRCEVFRDSEGRPVRMLGTAQDVTERAAFQNELSKQTNTQTVLFQELHHRVKNNLAAIIGICLKEQERAKASGIVQVLPPLNDIIGRIKTLAAVHSHLAAAKWMPIEPRQLCEDVVEAVFQYPLRRPESIEIKEAPTFTAKILPDQAAQIALVLNELLSNTLQHSGVESERLRINVAFSFKNGAFQITYRDNGRGYPQKMLSSNHSFETVGFDLIFGIVESSLHGRAMLVNDNGAVAMLTMAAEMVCTGQG